VQQPFLNHPDHIGLTQYRLVTTGLSAPDPRPLTHLKHPYRILQLVDEYAVISVLLLSSFGGLTVE
jgi:hypothetical protein